MPKRNTPISSLITICFTNFYFLWTIISITKWFLNFQTNKMRSKYMFKVNNRNTKTRYEICSKLTIKASERHQWRRCFHCQLWTYFTSWSSVSIVNFEQVNAGWIALSHNGYSINVANCEIFRKIRWLIFCFLTTCFANLEYLLKETRNSSKIRPLNFEKKQ